MKQITRPVGNISFFSDPFSYPEHFDAGGVFMEESAALTRCVTDVSTVEIVYCLNGSWLKSTAGPGFPKTSLPNMLYRAVVETEGLVLIEDCLKHFSYKFICMEIGDPMIRFICSMPVTNASQTKTNTVTLLDHKPGKLSDRNVNALESISRLISIYMITD